MATLSATTLTPGDSIIRNHDRKVRNLGPYLPSLVYLDGKPMSLASHYPFEPFFNTDEPVMLTVRAGRQIGKTRQISARELIHCAFVAGSKLLVVLPLQEQSDRISHEIFKPMLDDSPISVRLRGDVNSRNSVRVQSWQNRSSVTFSYAGDSADRIRSVSAPRLWVDESQHVDTRHLSIITEVQSSFIEARHTIISGTSNVEDSLLQMSYDKSSQGVWHIKCTACGYDNRMTTVDGDLHEVVGSMRDDISKKRPGTICRGCSTTAHPVPINPRAGRWVHRYPERMADHLGFGMPQPIFEFHACYPKQWADLVSKRDGRKIGYGFARYMNDVLGEAYSFSIKLLTLDNLRKASVLGPNDLTKAAIRTRHYEIVVLSIDWGGGGSEGVSATKIAAIGFAPDGGADVFYGEALPFGLEPGAEAKLILQRAAALNVTTIVHDFNGAGSAREAVLTQLNWPVERIAPVVYHETPGAKIFRYLPATGARYRGFFHLSKSIGLQYVAAAIRLGIVRFFDFDYIDPNEPGLIADLTNYVEANFVSPAGKSVYRVRPSSDTVSTDFADAVAMGLCFLWEYTAAWPAITV